MTNRRLPLPRYLPNRNSWQIQMCVNKMRKSFTVRVKTSDREARNECERRALDWLDRIDRGYPNDPTLKEAWNAYLDYYSKAFKYTSYQKVHTTAKAHFDGYWNKRVNSMLKSDWQAIINRAHQRGCKSMISLKGIASIIKTFCKFLAMEGVIPDGDVPIYFGIPTRSKARDRRALQPDEIRLLFDESQDNELYIDVFRFMVLTGLRRGEVCALQRARDMRKRTITVNETMGDNMVVTGGKTANAKRVVPLPELAIDAIFAHEKKHGRSVYLFAPHNLKFSPHLSPRRLRDFWQEWREKHNINVTLHELRHTYISYSRLRTTKNLEELKRIYGHAPSMDTERVYVHGIQKTPEELEQEAREQEEYAKAIDNVFEAILD